MDDKLLATLLENAIAGQGKLTRSGSILTRAQQTEYSLTNLLLDISGNGKRASMEREISENHPRIGPNSVTGIFLPFDGLSRDSGERIQRDMVAGVFGQGGALVETNLGAVVPLLQNRVSAVRLGATVLEGLQGNFNLPRITGAVNPQSLPEIGAVAGSNPIFDQIALSPKRLSVKTTISKQLLLQQNRASEAFVRAHLGKTLGIQMDYLLLNGQGGNSQPLGIMNSPGIGQIVLGGTTTWSDVLAFEQSLAAANADQTGARMAYLSTPATRSRWKQIQRLGVNASGSVTPDFIWQAGSFSDGSGDGLVNSFRAAVSNNTPGNQVIFGNWNELLVCIWGNGLDMVYDPYTSAANGEVNLILNLYFDCALLHPQSFCVSADSGAL